MQTLNQALSRAAERADCGLRILDRRERETWLSWPELYRRSSRTAGGLRGLGFEPGETVGLFYLTGEAFFEAFFGILLAGAVPVPLYPPVRLGRLAEYHTRTARMLRAAGVRRVLADARLRRIVGEALSSAGCESFTLTEIERRETLAESVDPEALALVQFSSGTTLDPKPVALTHRALLAQAAGLNGFWPDTPGLRHSGVSWLPLYHDMGLIGCVFTVLERPSTMTLIPPEIFVSRPAVWLRALSRFKATVSPAPNFAYSLCTEKIKDEQLQGVDLSQWRAALCGAETIVPAVLQRFADRFAPFGFRREALTPVYGLSEAALAVTFSEIDKPFTYRVRSRAGALSAPTTAPGHSGAGPNGRQLVSVGRPLPGFEVEIRSDAGERLAEGEEGQIWVRGPSLMREYLNQPEATAKVLRDGWLDTGDLGLLRGGELYVSGRAKDVLIVRGANLAPDEVEAAVSELPMVRTGCAAAVGHLPTDAEREQIWLFVEPTQGRSGKDEELIVEACKQQVLARTGVGLDRVEVLDPGTLPRTSSGKIRRHRALALYLAGELHPPERVTASRRTQATGRSAWAQERQSRRSDVG